MKTKKLVDLFLSNPTKENFAAMKDDVVAISLVYAKLKDKKKLTTFLDFDEAQKFYHTFDGELKTAAFQKMEELATTLDELNELFSNSGIQGKELIFQKM